MQHVDFAELRQWPPVLTDEILAPILAYEKDNNIEVAFATRWMTTPKQNTILICMDADCESPFSGQQRRIFSLSNVITGAAFNISFTNAVLIGAQFRVGTHVCATAIGSTIILHFDIFDAYWRLQSDVYKDNATVQENYKTFLVNLCTWIAQRLYIGRTVEPAEVTNFSRNIRDVVEAQLGTQIRQVTELSTQIETLQEQLTNVIAQYEASSKAIGDIETVRKDLRARIEQQLQHISELPEITGVYFRDNAIHAITREIIYSHSNKKTYRLGAFKISLRTSGRGVVEIRNLTHSFNGWPHPHYHGGPCWGGFGTAIATSLSLAHFDVAMAYVVKWLTAIDTNDAWGESLYLWPTLDKETL